MGVSIRHIIGSKGGFTLIELLTVVAIIGILATIAVPMFLGQRTKAMQKEAMTNLESLRLLQEQYFAENGTYAPSAGDCDNPSAAGVDAIKGELPGFKPGIGEDLYFRYCMQKDMAIDTADPLSDPISSKPGGANDYECFVARAFGKPGSQVAENEFKVDCNNVKTY